MDASVEQLQQALIDVMIKNGSLKSPAVEHAFRKVARHPFLPGEPLERVYSDVAIAVRKGAENQWTSSSSQPTMMAIMLEQLELQPGMRVLEIGTGSGYNAALMGAIVGPTGRVISVDIQPDLVEEANQVLAGMDMPWVRAISGDGGYGYPDEAPYDRILLTVGAWSITPAWHEQLADGGRLVLPLGLGKTQKSVAFERRGNALVSLSISDCGFMVLQGAFAAPPKVTQSLDENELVNLIAEREAALPADAQQMHAWLLGPTQDWPSGVSAQPFEIWGGLFTWLTLQEPDWVQFSAEQEAVDHPYVPEFFFMGNGQEFRSRSTALLVLEDGMAALVRPPGQSAPYLDWNSAEERQDAETPFELHVRQYGAQTAASRLLAAVQAWGQAGQPGSGRMHIRAVPAETDVPPAEGEFRLERPWTTFLISFDQAS